MQRPVAVSRLTSKYQATIPRAVRRMLGLKQGDRVAFAVHRREIHLRKAGAVDLAYLHALEPTLTEWGSKADDEAYRDL